MKPLYFLQELFTYKPNSQGELKRLSVFKTLFSGVILFTLLTQLINTEFSAKKLVITNNTSELVEEETILLDDEWTTDYTTSLEKGMDYEEEHTPASQLQYQYEWTPWDYTRKEVYTMCADIKHEYEVSVDTMLLYDWWMKVFYAECSLRPDAVNNINAKGIVQWTRSKRKELDVPENINEYSFSGQLPYVKQLFDYEIKSRKIDTRKINSFSDIYCIVFAPAFITASDHKTMYKSCLLTNKACKRNNNNYNSKRICAYHANSPYDIDSDSKIKKGETGEYIINKYY